MRHLYRLFAIALLICLHFSYQWKQVSLNVIFFFVSASIYVVGAEILDEIKKLPYTVEYDV